MPTLKASSRTLVYGPTVCLWLILSGLSLYGLIQSARLAPPGTIEAYARTPSYQLVNFAIGLLPGLLLVLGVLIGVEWLLFRVLQGRHTHKA